MKIYKKAILPLGFKANAVACGIKKSGKLDLALFYSDVPVKAACQFTTNKIQAACIKLNRRYLKNDRLYQAIIVNSGNANAFTGKIGLRDAEDVTCQLAQEIGIKKENILIASTGIIGRRLPLSKIKMAIPALVSGLSRQGIDKAKMAIMTTDTVVKEITVKFNLGNRTVTLCGVAKGSGMIAPNLACPQTPGATMLCFLFTDANISQGALNKALNIAVEKSFNCITVDGCMSTNDSVMLLANGSSVNVPIDTDRNFNLFAKALDVACIELAKMIIKDAEGATKFIRIKVSKAHTFKEAKKIALSIANSNLCKTAIYGRNPNYGRIIAAIGTSGLNLKEENIQLKVSPLYNTEVNVDVSVGQGNATAVVYTSDLTPEYVKINAQYN